MSDDIGEPEQRNAWWLSTRRRRPEWQSLRAAGVATFSGRPRAHYEAAKPGDPVLFYLARPDHAIRAVGVVSQEAGSRESGVGSRELEAEIGKSGLPTPDSRLLAPGPYIEIQYAFEVPDGLPWRAIQGAPSLVGAEPVRQRSSGTLFKLTSDEYEALRGLIEERNPELAAAFASIKSGELPGAQGEGEAAEGEGEGDRTTPTGLLREEASAYGQVAPRSMLPAVNSLAELEQLTGLSVAVLEETRDLLEDVGQIVLSGPPGTGKTWLARGLAVLVAGDPRRVQIVQFHPATTYEDFIEGLKPRVDAWGHVTYAVLPGIFVRMCQQANFDSERNYVLVIDEINRAPLARVFGELLYALEYRGPEGAVELSVSAGMDNAAQPFYVPENLLIVGTMNSADRSLALVDYALRRRFRFVELEPDSAVLDRWLREHGNSAACRRVVLDLLAEVNRRLSESLDPDHRLGHSYFMLDPLNGATLDRLWRTAIKPLLSEYFIPPAGEVEEYKALFGEAVEELDSVKRDG